MNLAEKMVMYRAKNRITQKELAKRVGVTPMTISNVESGKQEPNRVTRAKILLVVDKDED